MDDTKKKKLIIVAIVFIIIVAILIVVFVILQRGKKGRLEIPQIPLLTTGGKITADPQPAGETVIISNVTLTQPGFVIIHEETNGNPEKIIGRSELLQVGTKSSVTISLDRKVKSKELLFAILHNDDGSQAFESQGADLPSQDPNGKTVLARFKIR